MINGLSIIAEKDLKYKRADNKVINPAHRPLNIDYDRYVTIKNHLRNIEARYSRFRE